MLGETVGALSVNVDAVTHMASKEIVSTRKQLAHVPDDKTNTLYELVLDGAKSRGFYLLSLTAGSQVSFFRDLCIKLDLNMKSFILCYIPFNSFVNWRLFDSYTVFVFI